MTALGAGDYTETRLVPLRALRPSPRNPRLIRDARFRALCQSLEEDPGFLWDRPILARENGEIIAGNMRYRAAEHLGWRAIPARLLAIPEQQALVRGLRDNAHFGEFDEAALEPLVAELQAIGTDLTTLGFGDEHLAQLLDSSGALGDLPASLGAGADPLPQAHTCPACGHRWED